MYPCPAMYPLLAFCIHVLLMCRRLRLYSYLAMHSRLALYPLVNLHQRRSRAYLSLGHLDGLLMKGITGVGWWHFWVTGIRSLHLLSWFVPPELLWGQYTFTPWKLNECLRSGWKDGVKNSRQWFDVKVYCVCVCVTTTVKL